MMINYTEYLWTQKITFEFQGDGHAFHPIPKCEPLPIPKQIGRHLEVQLMSLCYTNNLLNGFVHRYNSQKFPNPLCHCGEEEQTNYHIAAQCKLLSDNSKAELIKNITRVLGDTNAVPENPFLFLNSSRDYKVINSLIQNIKSQSEFIRKDIEL